MKINVDLYVKNEGYYISIIIHCILATFYMHALTNVLESQINMLFTTWNSKHVVVGLHCTFKAEGK